MLFFEQSNDLKDIAEFVGTFLATTGMNGVTLMLLMVNLLMMQT